MQIWITFILINIIHQTHVSAAPVDSSFAKIADTIINPAWIKNNPDSPKENGENIPIDGEIDYSNTKNKKKNNSRRKNKTSSKKRNNNKTRNNRRRNNTGHNERYLWYSVFTVDDLIVNLPEYRNHEDEQKIVLIWDDKRKIVQNEHVDTLSMYNLNNNQLIRQKRDYNNILELQDNILKTKNINQHDLEENENSMSSNSNENTNENMEFLNLRNSNTNKLKNILKNRKQPTNTIRNEISRPSHAQGLGIPLGADNSEKEESQLKIIEENPQKKNAKTTLSNDKPELIIGENTSIEKNTPEIEKIDTLINGMNSNLNEGADYEQDSESYPLTIEPKNKIQNYSYIVDNKQHDIIKNIKHQFKPKTRQLEKKQPKNNGEGILQTRFTLNAPSKNEQKTPSIPEHKIEGNTNIAKNITTNDEIETLLNAMNSNSQENSSSKNLDLNTSSLEKQQDILDLSDLGDNKQNNLLKTIKQPLKPISKIEGKTLLENNEKQPEIYEKYINNPSETNTKNKKGSQLIGNTPSSQSIKNQKTPSIDIPEHKTEGNTDISQNIPSNVEIETLMNAINLNSEENSSSKNSDLNTSSLEKQQDILDLSDLGDNKQNNLLKTIKQPLKPISKIEGKTLLENNEKQPEIYEKYINNPSETNTKNKKGSQLIGNTPSSQSIKNQQTPSINVPGHITPEHIDISQNIPSNVEIKTLKNAINLNSEEGTDDQNSEPYSSSLEIKQEIPNYSDDENNKQNDTLKNIEPPFKHKSRKLGKIRPKNNDKGTLQTRFTPNAPSKNYQKTPSIDIPEYKTERNTDISQNIPTNDGIETLLNAMNSNSQENSSSKNSDLNTSSLEKRQDIQDLSDLGNNKQNNLLKSIKQPLKPISKIEGKTLLENNEKQPEIYEKYINNPSETNTKNKKGSQLIGNTPFSQSIKNQQTPSINVPGHITPEHIDISQNIPSNVEIKTLKNAINLNSEEGTDDQNSEPYSSSLEIKQEIPNYSDDENNKQNDTLKNIEPPFKHKSRKLGKIRPKNNDKGTLQTRFTPNAPSKNYQKTPSIDIPEYKTERNTDISQNIPTNDKIETLLNAMNSNSQENSSSKNSDLNTSSLEKQQDILDLSDLGDNKQNNLLNSIKQPLKPISKIEGKTLLENNEKQPEIYEKYLNNPSETNTKNKKGSQLIGNTPSSQSIKNQQTPSINVPGHKTEGNTDISQNIPSNVEIETLMNAINLNSEENSSSKNSDLNTSSLEKQQDILDLSDLGDNKQNNLLKTIKQPLKPISKIEGKTLLENNEKQPEIYEKYINNPSETNTKNKKGSQLIGNTPSSQSIKNQQTPSINVPGHITPEHIDISQNIPSNVEIKTLKNAINLNSEEGTDDQNSEPYSSSLDIKQEIPNYSDDENNKQNDTLKNIEPPFKHKSRKLGKIRPKNNDKGTLQTRFTPNAPSKNYQKTPSIDIPEYKTERNTDISQNIPTNDKIETLLNAMNSNSQENSSSKNSDLNTSSLEKQQDILDLSDLGDNKQNNLLKTIKQPLKPISKIEGKTLLENNEKQPEIYEKYINNPSETNTKNKKGSQLIGNTPSSQSIKNQQTPSINVPGHITPEHIDISQNIPSNVEIKTLKNAINLNSEEGTDDQNSEPYSSSLDIKQEIPNYSDDENNKQNDTLKNIEPPFKHKSRKLGKIRPKNNDKGTLQTRFTPNAPSRNYQKTPSIDIPEYKTERNTDISQNIPTNDKIETLLNAMNSNSQENSSSKNSDLNTSSLEKQQDILDLSDLGDNKQNNLLNSIKQPLKPISKIEGKTLLENNEKQPEIYEKYINNPSETNTKNKKGSQLIGNTPSSQSIKNQKTPSIDIPEHKTEGNTDISQNIPSNVEIETLMNAINLNSEENSSSKNSDLNTSSLEKRQDIQDLSDLGDNKQNNLLKSIKQPLKPISKIEGKTLLENNEKQPEIYEKYINNPSETNTKNKKGSQLIGNTPSSQSIKNQQTPSINVPGHITPEHTDISQNIPSNVEIKTLKNAINLNSEENSFSKNSDLNTSSLEKQQDILDLSDLGDNKGKNLLKSIIQPLKPLSKMEEKKMLENNEKLPGIYKQKFNNSLEINKNDEEGPQQKTLTPITQNLDQDSNVEAEKLQPIQTNNDDIPNIIQKNKSIKTPDLIDTPVPKATEKVIGLTTETPLNDIDVSDSLGEYNKLGGFTMEDAGLEIIKDETPSSTLNYNSMKDHDDSLQVTNQPMLMKPNTVKPNTEHKEGVHINIDEVPKSVSDGKEKKKLVDEFGSNSYADLFGGSLDFNEEDLSQPGMNKKKVIPISKTNDIIKNVGDEKLQPIPTKNDDIPNIIQKNKSIKTLDLIDTTVPKATEKVIGLTTETPLNDIDVSDSLGEYNKLGGFTMEDAGLEIIKDETPSSTLNYNSMKDHDDSLQVTNQPMLMKPNTVNPNTEHKEGVHINIDEVPKSVSDGKEKKKLVDEFGSNSYADLFGGSLDFNEEDLSQPAMNKKKVIPISKTNDIIKNVEDEKLQPIPTKNDDIPNIIQKNKSIKTPDLIDTTVPKATEKVIGLTTETPLNDIDVSDSLGEYNKLGGFTMEDAGLEIIKDETPSSTLNYNSMKDHDDSLQVTNQPMLMKPNTVNPNTEHKEGVHINIDEVPKSVSDGKEKKKLVDEFGSNSYADLFGGSLDFNEEDLSQPGMNKKKVIPISKTNDIIKNVGDEKLQPIPTKNDDIPNIIQKNKSIKTLDLIDTTVPKATEKVVGLTTETPLNDIDVSDSLGEYNKLGGFTMEDAGLEIIKDETPSSTLNYNSMKDHDDSLQVTNQPMLMKPNTVKPNTEHKEGVHINIDEVPKSVSDGKEKKKLVDEFGSNSYADLFGGSLDFNEEDLSQPGMNKKKVIPISKTNDIIKNVGDEKLQPIPTKNDDIPNIIQKNKSIKTLDLIDTTVPKATEKVIGLTTETPLNDIDVSDSLGEYNKLGGFTMEDAGLEIIKDETPSSTLNYNSMKDHDDSLQVTNQPMLMKPNTVNPNTEHKEGVHINIDEVPKSVSDGKEKKKLVDEFGSNSYADLFGGSLDFNEEDLSQPAMNKKKVIPISKTNDIIKNVEDEKLQPIPTKNDDIPNIIQKNKSIKTPDLIDTTVPKATEKVIGLTTETPLNDIDVSDSLGEYKKLGGFTMEDAGLEIIKDETPSSTLNYNSMKDHDDSLQVTNQPMLMKPNTVKPNTEHKEGVHINIDEVPKSVSNGKEKKKFVDEFGSNSYADLFGGSLDFNEEDLSQPAMNKKKVIPISKTNDIIKNVGDEKLQPIPTKNDDIPNIIQKNKSIKTPDLIDTTVPKSTEKVMELATETPLNDIDVSDSLEEYNKLGGFTMKDAGLEIIKDETPSSTLNYNSMKDHDDSLQVTNQPMLMKPNTVKPNTEHKEGVHINIDEVPKSVSDGKEKKKLVDKFGSNSYADLFGGSLDFNEEDLSQPAMNKKKVIPISKTNDFIKNVGDEKLQPIPTKNDDIPNIIQKNKSIKTPDLIDTTVPKATEKVIGLTTETPLNDIDVSDSLGEYNKLGGFTMEDAGLEIIKDETPSSTLNYNSMKDHDDSLQVTNQPMLMKPNTVKPNTEHKEGVHINIDEVPKSVSNGKEKKKFVDEFGSNSYADLFGGSLDFNEEDLSQPAMNKKKVIPISKTNDIIKNVGDEKLQPIPTKNDDIPNIIQKNKSIKTPDLIDTTVPKSTEKVMELATETPLNDIDVSDSLEEYNKLGGFTMKDAGLEIIKDETPSSTLNYNSMKDHDDSLQVTNQPMLMKPNTVKPNTEHKEGVHINIDEVPKSVSDGEEKKKFTTQINYDILKNDNKLPSSKILSNVIDKHSSNSNTIHKYNNNLFDNDKDVTFNRSLITNPCVEYNSKDLSSLEDGDRYGYMLPKFRTKYSEGGESNFNLWETIPPKKNDDISSDKGYDNLINDFNQSSDFTTKNNEISSHTLNENNIVTGTESVKNNNCNIDKVNTDIHNKQYDDLIKKMSEQLFKKIDNIDDKLAKLDKVSHNSSYVREIGNIGSHEPTMNNGLLSNGIPISKPEKVINIEDSYSKTTKPSSLEINTSNKSDDENEINKNESPKAKKHKNKKHKRHGNKKKDEKNNTSNDDDGDDDYDDDDDDDNDDDEDDDNDDDNYDDNRKNNKRHKHKDKHNDDDGKNKRHKNKDLNNDDDGKHKQNKRHKNKDINNDDDGKHKKNKRHKNKDLNDNDNGEHKKNKGHKKNKKIDNDNDNGGHRKKSHKKIYNKVDDDVVSKHKKHKSNKKKDRNYNDVELLQSKMTDNKKKKKIKENVYSTEESNDVNYSSSIQINSENSDSVKRLKTTSSKSKISKKTNSTKSKKSSPKKKSKSVKHSKTIKYKNKEIPVDVSDEDTSSNENNYNSEKTYIKYISNNNQNNVPKDKKHKHKKHNKHSKTSKTYINKKIPEDKDSDENSVNLEETYNINIISDDDAPRQKNHRHKKKKNFDINIVKDTDTDTDTQVLNNDKKPQAGYQFYALYPQY